MDRILRVSAYALLVEDARIVLCRLSPHISHTQEWTLPGGGIEFGEHPREAAIREVREETGLEIEIQGDPHVNSELFEFRGNAVHAIRLIYKGVVAGGTLTHEVEGSTDRCEWFGFDEVANLPLVTLAQRGVELALG
jgi:8-oxo-dGTP diphosphatase